MAGAIVLGVPYDVKYCSDRIIGASYQQLENAPLSSAVWFPAVFGTCVKSPLQSGSQGLRDSTTAQVQQAKQKGIQQGTCLPTSHTWHTLSSCGSVNPAPETGSEFVCGGGRLSGFVPLREATSEGRFVALLHMLERVWRV